MPRDWDLRGDELAADAIAAGEPTAWFDRLYTEGAQGAVAMPWDRDDPHPLLREWAELNAVVGSGRRAVVVGCGLGADAEYVSRLGFTVTAFDVAPTAVQVAVERHPATSVDYRVADLLALPGEWHHAFDLVVEVFTVQALPDPPRAAAIRSVSGLLAPGGTLLAIAFAHTKGVDPTAGPPFALTRQTMQQFAVDGVRVERVEEVADRWRVEYRR